jgi:hypothetical protein
MKTVRVYREPSNRRLEPSGMNGEAHVEPASAGRSAAIGSAAEALSSTGQTLLGGRAP